jgi:SLT domain-containing protein
VALKRTTVKNFYRALAASAYVAGATAAGLALGGPPGAAAAAASATANLASPLGVASVELAAELGTDAALDSTKMAMGGLVTQPTFAMIGEAGPEMVIPLTGAIPKKKKRKVSKYQKEFGRQIKKLIAKHPRTDVTALMARAHKATRLELKMPRKSTRKGQVRKTARRAFER